jgi:hypothetical protein
MLVYNRIIDSINGAKSRQIRIDAIKSLATLNIPYIEKDLRRLMFDSDSYIRMAVLELAEDLPRYQAHGVISIALEDEDSNIVEKATSILETRWPDDFW